MKIDTQTLKQILIAGVLLLLLVALSPLVSINSEKLSADINSENSAKLSLDEQVIPSKGVVLPIDWASLGQQMIESGVIDSNKFSELYEIRGGLSPEMEEITFGSSDGPLTINRENSGVLLNLLWAFGLSNKNEILEEGPMKDPQYGGDAGRFASTGGWSLASGNPMDHYSMHSFVILTTEQQKRVENVSKGIYRPCCGNSVYFPDCNHGMAMLGLLELMAREGVGEEEMYKIALQVNSYWFPDTYLNIAKYFSERGLSWDEVNSKEVLGSVYSSARGYQQILASIEPVQLQGGGGCGI